MRRAHVVLHRALGQAVRWGLVVRNVADLVEKPRAPRSVGRALCAAEAQRLLVAARGERVEWLVYPAVTTGMRERGAVSVSRQLVRLRGGGGL